LFRQGIKLGAVEGLLAFEHAVKGVEEITHDGDKGLHFGFVGLDEVQVENLQLQLMRRALKAGMLRARRRWRLPVLLMRVFLCTELPEEYWRG
jgi:hypothetical protein